MSFTADDLLESIKRGISVPNYQVRFTDADILSFADEEIQTRLVPMITSLREEYFIKIVYIPMVQNQRDYQIPYRAVGRTVRDVKWYDGNVKSGMMFITPNDEQYYTNVNVGGRPSAFYFIEDKIAVCPAPNASSGYIEVKYELRPNKLAILDDVGTISAINTTTGVVTLSAALTGLTTSTPIDFIRAKAGNVTYAFDVSPTNVSSTLVTFDPDDLPSDLAVGDYVAFAGYTPVVQLPEEAHPVLANAVHCRLLRALGDYEGLNIEEAVLAQRLSFLRDALSPRVEGHPPVVMNRKGMIRRRGNSIGRRRFV